MLNVLIAYPYLRKSKKLMAMVREAVDAGHVRLMLDSGAFSAFHIGEKIDLTEYCAFIEEWKPWLWEYVALDVVGDKAATMRNLTAMVARGLKPMPVLTHDMHVDTMPELVACNERVCVAGATVWGGEWAKMRISEAQRASGDKARIHGLGFTSGLNYLSCASVDSSTWINGSKYGSLFVFSAFYGIKQFAKVLPGLRVTPFASWPLHLRDLLVRHRVSPQDIVMRGAKTDEVMNRMAIGEWLRMAQHAARHDCLLFFAAGAPAYFDLLYSCYKASSFFAALGEA